MTYAVQGALQKAVAYSKEYELQNIEVEALLKAAMNENDSLFKSILERANIDVDQLIKAYDNQLSHYPTVQGDNVQYGQYISAKTNELLDKAEKYMKSYEDEFISMEHILRAAIDTDETTQKWVGNKVEVIKEIITKVRGGNHVTSQNPEVNYEALEKYGLSFIHI